MVDFQPVTNFLTKSDIMANIHQFYLEHMASKTGYRATWEPNRPLTIGAIYRPHPGEHERMDSESEDMAELS